MNKKIIQIAAISDETVETLYALCEDGSVYSMYLNADDGLRFWVRIPEISGDEQ
jgi:hypothetical protein